MRKLLNTLFVTRPTAYLSLDGENIVVLEEEETLMRLPLHNLEGVVTFGYTGASPALMAACAQRNISLCFMSGSGRFLARVTGEVRGNVLLRKAQYRLSECDTSSLSIAKNMIIGKLYNSRWVLERALRDHAMRIDATQVKAASAQLWQTLQRLPAAGNAEELRGLEGEAASRYFRVFNELILQNKEAFVFRERSRRPPLDRVNALLSFVYVLLAAEMTSALETVGLDPYVGFLHTDRPGRASLAFDMMEELRSVLADRLVLSLINRREVNENGFELRENGTVLMDKDTRKTVLTAWQAKKQEELVHPFLEEKMPWGLVPYAQALLMARFIRGDLDEYPPLMWK